MWMRLLLVLVVALSAPAALAMPACHAAAMPMHHGTPAPDRPEPANVATGPCLGCVAPTTARPPVVAAVTPPASPAPDAHSPAGLARPALPPATPPPRAG